MKLRLFGLEINTETKNQILDVLESRINQNRKTFIVTPYSEFFGHAARNYKFRDVINAADIALPDGIGVQWAAYYDSIPLKSKNYYLKIFEAFLLMILTGVQILFSGKRIKSIIPEKISGSSFFWDLVSLASQKNLKIFLLGGFENTPELVAKAVQKRFPNVQLAGFSNGGPEEISVDEINKAGTDILMVAYGPVTQEFWIKENLERLNVKIAIGLGGTFDYVAGKKPLAPLLLRNIGLEWLFRLFTQPERFKRIWNGVIGLILIAIRYKVFMSMPFRANIADAIINKENKVFLGKRNPNLKYDRNGEYTKELHWQFPQGGIDQGEEISVAAIREAREETGMRSLKFLGVAGTTHCYHWNHGCRYLWKDRQHKGQEQQLAFLRFEGNNSEIDLNLDEDKEFSEYQWVAIEDVPKLVHPFRQPLVKIFEQEIKNYINER